MSRSRVRRASGEPNTLIENPNTGKLDLNVPYDRDAMMWEASTRIFVAESPTETGGSLSASTSLRHPQCEDAPRLLAMKRTLKRTLHRGHRPPLRLIANDRVFDRLQRGNVHGRDSHRSCFHQGAASRMSRVRQTIGGGQEDADRRCKRRTRAGC